MRPQHPPGRGLALAVAMTGVLLTSFAAASPALAATGTTKAPVKSSAKQSVAKPAIKKVTNPLPVMNVTDIKTGKPVPLASTFNGSKSVLVWFWAPH